MRLGVVGCGYVGLVTAACFADLGHTVHCVEHDSARLALLRQGGVPLYEPGLDGLLQRNREEGRLHFHGALPEALDEADIVFIAVGTPPLADGRPDLHQVLDVAAAIGRHACRPCIVVSKSTVPVGTADRLQALIDLQLRRRRLSLAIPVVSNPEFLKEGAAIDDFMKPDRIVIGSADATATARLQELYTPFNRNHQRLLVMGRRDAEMVKYAANAMLATRISFINEIANLCDRLGVDVENVRLGMGADARIGHHFLYPGLGYGGACLPKDVRALRRMAQDVGYEAALLEAVHRRNEAQKDVLLEKVRAHFDGTLAGKRFAVWGLAFKPNTDDMREAPSRAIIAALLREGATVSAYDPAAMKRAAQEFPPEWQASGALRLARNQYEALDEADALLLLTEWRCFREPDLDFLAHQLRHRVIFDGRNVLRPESVQRHGLMWLGMGRRLDTLPPPADTALAPPLPEGAAPEPPPLALRK